MDVRVFRVSAAHTRNRLDVYLAHSTGLSRAQIQRLIDSGAVRVNAQVRKAHYLLSVGDTIQFTPPPAEVTPTLPEPLPLPLIYEDADLLAVNKPPGLVVHPAAGHRSGTLVNALLHHRPALARIGSEGRAGIVHRLDKDTSGLLLVAKTAAAHAALSAAFAARQVQKTYLALVHGEVRDREGTIAAAIGRHLRDRKKMGVNTRKGREAVTVYQVRERYTGVTLLEVYPATGRTHQIRVHLSSAGHPVVGDTLYGGRRERKASLAVPRQMLHAWRLACPHPRTGKPLTLEAPLPEDMQRILTSLSPRT